DRSAEVGAWLDAHPCESYVIIDDLAEFEERPEVVKDHLVIVEDSEGIRYKHFYRALSILSA
ncbi:MAG: HAD domain-containing protein, partial [Coriobacteriales bacterium]|nr:HAD domain-containing protein [Coriobacteriales bacterium]